jgi:hypothetical protein
LDYQNIDKHSHLINFKNNGHIKQLPYCFNKNKININNIKYLSFKIVRDYVYNKLSPKIIKLKYGDNLDDHPDHFHCCPDVLNKDISLLNSDKTKTSVCTEKINDY